MKEVREWDNNPRMMWVWDSVDEKPKKKFVIYIQPKCYSPVIALYAPYSNNTNIFKHCAEIEEEQKTSEQKTRKGFYVYNPAGTKPSYIHETLEEAKDEAERIFKLNLEAGIKEPIEVLEIVGKYVPKVTADWE